LSVCRIFLLQQKQTGPHNTFVFAARGLDKAAQKLPANLELTTKQQEIPVAKWE